MFNLIEPGLTGRDSNTMILHAERLNMKNLSSNRDLYEYLLRLISELRNAGADKLARVVTFAAEQAAGISTEFLGEARLALREVLNEENRALTEEGRADLINVIEQLNQALDQR
jgi:hypothetical protein